MSNSLSPLTIKPGIVKDYTDYAMENRWIDGDKVRFRGPFPEKIGGWTLSNYLEAVVGITRSLRIWTQLNFASNIALGTHNHLYISQNGKLDDITPLRKTTTNLSEPFATNGTNTVVVTDVAHGGSTGDYITIEAATINAITQANPAAVTTVAAHGFSTGNVIYLEQIEGMIELNDLSFTITKTGATTFTLNGIDSTAYSAYTSDGDANEFVDGILVNEDFAITVIDADTYSITLEDTASGTTAAFGGTEITIAYNITSGHQHTSGAGGWGSSYWSRGGWGSSVTTAVHLSVWSMDTWGEDLVACSTGGGIYYWDATNGPEVHAAALTNAPATARFIKVDADTRHLIAYGAHTGSIDDPMFIRWCDQENITTWTATAINTAGDYRLTSGSKIITAISSRSATLVFTDTSLYAQNYTGAPFTFRFNLLADSISIAGQKAAVERDEIIYWMGKNQFYAYDGRVITLDSPVERYVFDNINRDHLEKSFVGVNRKFKEIWYFYCSGSNTEPDSYVTYNYAKPQDQIWSIGTLQRTCWHDSSMFVSKPIAIDSNGVFYNHESGEDNVTSALNPYIESGVIEITTQGGGKGGDLFYIDRLLPDATVTGNMQITLYTKKFPQNDTETTKGPYTITSTTEKVSFRTKGRQARIRLESSDIGDTWTLGMPRIRIRKAGKR